MKKQLYINHKSKKIAISLTEIQNIEDEKIIHIECKEANLNQEILAEDLADFIDLIPELIEKKKERERKISLVQIRLSPEEKIEIEKKAKENGYSSISSYIRESALKPA